MNSSKPYTNSELRKQMAQRLKVARDAMGLQSQQMASRIGKPPPTYSRYERDLSGMTMQALWLLDQKVGITASYMISGRLSDLPSDLARKIEKLQRQRRDDSTTN